MGTIEEELKKIKKPTSAFQYYVKAWNSLSEEEKEPFIVKANYDKEQYEMKKNEIIKEFEKEIMDLGIYLTAYTGGYSAIGLDNGAKSYETVGPVCNIVYYSKEEQEKWGVKVKAYEYYDNNYDIKSTLYHNEKYYKHSQYGNPNAKGTNVYTYGKTYNVKKDHSYSPIRKYRVQKDSKIKAGITTVHYTSFSDEVWTTSSKK